MSIDRNNYEEFVIDYLDGKLNTDLQQELMLFFALNPDLESEASMLENATLKPSHDNIFENKTLLKKEVNEKLSMSNIQEYLIAKIENDLSSNMKIELDNFILTNPVAQSELNKLLATISVPDKTIVYPNKKGLKKENKIISIYYLYAAAAVLFLIIATPFILNKIVSNSNDFASMPKIKSSITAPIKSEKQLEKSEKPKQIINSSKDNFSPKTNKNNAKKSDTTKNNFRLNDFEIKQLATAAFVKQELNLFDNTFVPIKIDYPKENNNIQNVNKNNNEDLNFLTLKQTGIKSIKDISSSATLYQGNHKVNYDKISWTDIAAFVIAKINKRTGSEIKIEKKLDNSGNEIAYGIKSDGFEFSRK